MRPSLHRLIPALGAALLVLAAGCASTPKHAGYAGGNGLSFNSPVIIVNAQTLDEGFAAEKSWIAAHYPNAQVTNQQFLTLADRRLDQFVLQTADGRSVTVWFDITAFLGKPPAS